ncbi:GntR family transcriptional regulator [Streptomyces sp. NPDC002845]
MSDPTPTPRVHPSLPADQVYAAPHQSITNGTMPAGTRLRVRDVAADMGTRVMPVREAIRRPQRHDGTVERTGPLGDDAFDVPLRTGDDPLCHVR